MASHILWFALQLMLLTAAELVWLCKFLRLCRHLCNIHQNSVITSRKKIHLFALTLISLPRHMCAIRAEWLRFPRASELGRKEAGRLAIGGEWEVLCRYGSCVTLMIFQHLSSEQEGLLDWKEEMPSQPALYSVPSHLCQGCRYNQGYWENIKIVLMC